jgi:hypothetical protein
MTIELFEPLTKPTAAQLNAIGDDQVTLNAAYRGTAIEPMQPLHAGAYDIFHLRHLHRWLLYDSTGQLEDLTATNDPVSLPDPETGFGLKDLDEIDWLTIGMIYRVTGCEYAYERREPPSA